MGRCVSLPRHSASVSTAWSPRWASTPPCTNSATELILANINLRTVAGQQDRVERDGRPEPTQQPQVPVLGGDDLGQFDEAGLGVVGRPDPDLVAGADVLVMSEELKERPAEEADRQPGGHQALTSLAPSFWAGGRRCGVARAAT
jgi:hypothetical protein